MKKENSKNDIKARAYYFSIVIIKTLDSAPKDYISQTLTKQLIRSATSIGANIIEAQAASSHKDFTNFLYYALKSGNETKFWLGFLRDTRDMKQQIDPLLQEVQELTKILGTSIITVKKNHMKTLLFIILFSFFSLLFTFSAHASLPSSASYKLDGYSFGAGGTSNNTTSSNFGLYGTVGEVEFGRPGSTNFKAGSGLTYLLSANVPGAPTLSTPGNNYDRIQFVLNTSGNPTDTTYALQISTSSTFATNVNYIKSDGTVGATLATTDFKTYTNWGGASGSFVTGLTSNTTYYIRAKARQGKYSESDWGPAASTATNNPTLTFSLDSSTITFSNLNPGNSYTDSSRTNTLTTSTNAYNGYIVYGKVTQALTASTGTIPNYTSPNSAPTTWSGTGFGYNTNDTNLTGGTANRFSGSKYAGFTTALNGDPVADDSGPVTTTPISNEQFTISYRITGDNTTKAGTYSNTILYSIVPSY